MLSLLQRCCHCILPLILQCCRCMSRPLSVSLTFIPTPFPSRAMLSLLLRCCRCMFHKSCGVVVAGPPIVLLASPSSSLPPPQCCHRSRGVVTAALRRSRRRPSSLPAISGVVARSLLRCRRRFCGGVGGGEKNYVQSISPYGLCVLSSVCC
jgi:hypothetical protein